ncbi:polyprenol phosphomannose-dependent alpha 1,6 mannosyltransferase MptB [Flavimarina sp. Hel_I_48]|uniref:polyprenol phosphomannose-dependent alpha 1,6 mannosyltransferase MptB n=1 Tax=Flavimarina sp. Hel_I_48 TaxID=1392488 RepID=UPI0004DF6EDB|nr:polyprenol phosphomannose-dependent alpha 1,6 mannosyltransferase MptB [Flavimarina sp. Hel_I_48]
MDLKRYFQLYKIPLLLVLSALAFYWSFAYDLQRWDFTKLITLYAALCFLSYKIISIFKGNWAVLVLFSVIFRLIFLLATPNLSQDFYRFLWDGQLVLSGINPYLFTPQQLFASGAEIAHGDQLLSGMGNLSATHFSNYPPINQLLFAIAAFLGKSSLLGGIIALRMLIIAADLGILYVGAKILGYLKLPKTRIFWYALNPFIIIELTGNLHFEGVMLFFMLVSIYLLLRQKWIWAAIILGISVSVKLLPLLFLPLLWQSLIKDIPAKKNIPKQLTHILKGTGKGILRPIAFYLIVLLAVLLTFAPLISGEFLTNFTATISLWFQKFEFNASVYYLIRWLGYQDRGFNMIAEIGAILPKYIFVFVVLLAFFRNNISLRSLLEAMLFAVSFYFLLSTTVHPWYLATPLLLSIFTRYRFPIVWCALVFLSYSAYGKNEVEENLWLVALEYSVAIGYAVWEFNKSEDMETIKAV